MEAFPTLVLELVVKVSNVLPLGVLIVSDVLIVFVVGVVVVDVVEPAKLSCELQFYTLLFSYLMSSLEIRHKSTLCWKIQPRSHHQMFSLKQTVLDRTPCNWAPLTTPEIRGLWHT